MKKILSILVMVLFGVTNVWAQGTSTIHAYAIYDPDCDRIYEQGGGTVIAKAIKQNKNNNATYTFGTEGEYSTATGNGFYSSGIFGIGAKKHPYKIAADVASSIDGYYFAKWCDVDTFGAKSMGLQQLVSIL